MNNREALKNAVDQHFKAQQEARRLQCIAQVSDSAADWNMCAAAAGDVAHWAAQARYYDARQSQQ